MNYLQIDRHLPLCTVLFVLVALSQIETTSSFSSGNVGIACSSGSPFHFPFSPQETPPPFAISATKNNRGSLFVTVYGLGNDVSFKGFFMKATARERNVGQFISIPQEGQLLDCGYPGGAVSHTSSTDKKAVTVEWASSGYSGDITFSATVVQSYSRYWTNINSSYTIDTIEN